MKNKILTAEELLQQEDCVLNDSYRTDFIVKQMKEFAKLHVEAALKKATEDAKILQYANVAEINKDSIINAYPLNLIK